MTTKWIVGNAIVGAMKNCRGEEVDLVFAPAITLVDLPGFSMSGSMNAREVLPTLLLAQTLLLNEMHAQYSL